jgi:hypothetical protein
MQRHFTTLPPPERAVFESEVAGLGTLGLVLRWAFAE